MKYYKEHGIKPIIGCEVYVAPRSRFDKEPNIDNKYNIKEETVIKLRRPFQPQYSGKPSPADTCSIA